MHVPGHILRGDEGPRGGVPGAGDRGVQGRDGGAVRPGLVDMRRGPGVRQRDGLLQHVLPADDGGGDVLGAVPQLGGDTAPAREGGQAEPVPVRRPVRVRVPDEQAEHGAAVLQRRPRQGRRPEERAQAPAQAVRPGPGPGRGGDDAGQPQLPAGRQVRRLRARGAGRRVLGARPAGRRPVRGRGRTDDPSHRRRRVPRRAAAMM